MASQLTQQGYFSVLRWRRDATRDEARNVAVILVDSEGRTGGVKSAPLSSISSRLQDQGLLDEMLFGLERQFSEEIKPDLVFLAGMRESLHHSIYVSEPQAVAVSDVQQALNTLYRAYVSPRFGGSRSLTKGRVLDQVMVALRGHGLQAQRGQYIEEFLFDVAIHRRTGSPLVIEVLSFAATRKDWTPIEHNAGHFLYALGRVGASGALVVQPPTDSSLESAFVSHDRVQRWSEGAGVRTIEPIQLQGRETVDQLLLSS